MVEGVKGESVDIHTLIQQRVYGYYELVKEYRDKIDEHVQTCEECHEKMVGWTSYLPKLRARMTVWFPKTDNDGQHMEQLKQLGPGQCLPCGCEVLRIPWTREQSSTKFYKALAEIMQVSEVDAKRIPESFRVLDLPLTIVSLRRLRDKFWFLDMSSGSEKIRDAEEGNIVVGLPETVGDFISKILSLHSGIAYKECAEHWYP